MKIKMRKEGWQMKVDVFDSYVIKTPKSRKEIEKNVAKYLKKINEPHKLEEKLASLIGGVEKSKKIILRSKIPLKFLAYPEFLKDGKTKQKKVVNLGDKIQNLIKKREIKETKRLINKFIKFNHKLWMYGIHEMPLKLHSSFGVLNGDIVLIDLFELTSDKKDVVKKLKKKSWRGVSPLRKIFPEEIVEYYFKQADKNFTIKNLDKLWKIKLK